MPATKIHPRKTECDHLYAWIKKKQKPATYAKISPKMTNPRDIAGNAEEEEKKEEGGRGEEGGEVEEGG